MLLSKKTSTGISKGFLIKVIIILIIITSTVIMLGKIDFPSPNKEIKKTIPNEKLKIVK
jgi:hypothetical protein